MGSFRYINENFFSMRKTAPVKSALHLTGQAQGFSSEACLPHVEGGNRLIEVVSKPLSNADGCVAVHLKKKLTFPCTGIIK